MSLCFDHPTMREPSRRALLASAGASLVGLGSAAAARSDVADAVVDATANATTATAAQSPRDAGTDWPMPRYDPACTGHAPDAPGPTDDVRVAWRTEIEPLSGVVGAPIALGDAIYVAGGGLLAIDAGDGERRFARTGPYRSAPVRARSDVYRTDALAVAGPGAIYGLNEEGGIGLPVVDAAIGSRRWTAEGGEPPTFSFGGGNPPPEPVAAGDSVYTALPRTDRLFALDADDGRTRWSVRPGPDVYGSVNRPAVRDGRVYATTTRPRTVGAYDVVDGTELWERELTVDREDEWGGSAFAPVATEAGVFVPLELGVALLAADSGDVEWKRTFDDRLDAGATVAVADGTAFAVIAGDPDTLRALDIETGEDEWTVDDVGGTAPVVADGVVYVADGNQIRAFDAATGDELFAWAAELVQGQPIVANERLYAVDGRDLIALEEA